MNLNNFRCTYIHLYSTFPVQKDMMVERFIRTIELKLFKTFSINGSFKWTEILQGLVKG